MKTLFKTNYYIYIQTIKRAERIFNFASTLETLTKSAHLTSQYLTKCLISLIKCFNGKK